MEKQTITREWYVAFSDTDEPQPWLYRIFTRKGFEHVECFAEGYNKTIISISSGLSGITPGILFNEEDPAYGIPPEALAFGYLAKGARVLRYSCEHSDRTACLHLANFVPSCVTLTKGILGFKSWAISPKGLFNDLLRKGAVEITEKDAEKFYKARVKELTMSGGGGDGGARDDARRREAEAKEQARLEKEQEFKKQNRTRRRKRGGASLLKTEGGELGTQSKLGNSA